jgi:L-serine kinase (ADP)
MFARTDALLAHEKTIPEHKNELKKKIMDSGHVTAIVADYQSKVVLDGHHRLEILKELGYAVIPVYWVDYQNNAIQVASWTNDAPLEKQKVLAAATHGNLFSPKTTRHMVNNQHVSTLSIKSVKLQEWMRQ